MFTTAEGHACIRRLHLSASIATSRTAAVSGITKRVRNVICRQVATWDRARRTRSNGKCFVSTGFPRKRLREHEVKSFRLSRYDGRSRFPTSAGKKRDFRPKQDYKDSVSRWYLPRSWIPSSATGKGLSIR